MPGGGGRGLDGSTEDQNKFPTAGKGEAGQAAAPDRRSGIAPDSEDSGVPFKVSLRCFLHSDLDINKSFPPTGSKRCLLPWASRNNRARVAQAGPRGAGEGRVAAARRARASDTRGGAGLALRGRSTRGLALGYSSPSLLPEVNSTMNARSPPVDGLRERIAAPLEKASAAAAAAVASFSAALGSGRSLGVAGRGRGAAGRRT